MTLGQYLQGQKIQIKKIVNFVEMHVSGFLSVEGKLLQLRKICKGQMIANEILYRYASLKFDFRSTVKAPEVSKGQ